MTVADLEVGRIYYRDNYFCKIYWILLKKEPLVNNAYYTERFSLWWLNLNGATFNKETATEGLIIDIKRLTDDQMD